MNNFICQKCKYKETDQISDIICNNPKCEYYQKFMEEELDELKECLYFEE